jgi:UDP-GlcNAc:undecaprenyl-phosphate GlcNAc-1-phosphate transferase
MPAASTIFHRIDRAFTAWMARSGVRLLRLSLGVVFLWFGVLKFFPGLSPAQSLAGNTITALSFGLLSAKTAVLILAIWESLIGLGLLTGLFLRGTLFLLWVQMAGTLTPLFLFPGDCFTLVPLAPTLEGQYIIKNIVLISAGIVIGATVILVFGAVDDIHGLSPLAKLFGQILAAGILVVMGVQIQNLHIPGGGVLSLSPELSVVVSLIWIVAFMNIINLIDGLDGLAAGITCITAFSMFIYATQTGVGGAFVDAALISIVMAGATLGFLRYNFNPASIFMGDSGSMLLGFLLGAVTIQGVLKSIAAAALIVPLMALAIPILDTGMAIARRLRKGISITHADKEHIHHRLLNMGHSQRQAVLLIYFWTALLCGTSLALKFMANNKFLWITLALAIGGFALTALPPIIRGDNGRGGKHRARRKSEVPGSIPVESGEREEG